MIATASTEEKRQLALELGADAAIDSAPQGMAERLIEANGGERVDIVLEMSGGEVFEESRKALAPFGRLVTYGIASREQNELKTGSLMRRSHSVVGFWLMHAFTRPGMFEEALRDLFARAARGDLRVVTGPDLSARRGRAGADRPRRAPHERQGHARRDGVATARRRPRAARSCTGRRRSSCPRCS